MHQLFPPTKRRLWRALRHRSFVRAALMSLLVAHAAAAIWLLCTYLTLAQPVILICSCCAIFGATCLSVSELLKRPGMFPCSASRQFLLPLVLLVYPIVFGILVLLCGSGICQVPVSSVTTLCYVYSLGAVTPVLYCADDPFRSVVMLLPAVIFVPAVALVHDTSPFSIVTAMNHVVLSIVCAAVVLMLRRSVAECSNHLEDAREANGHAQSAISALVTDLREKSILTSHFLEATAPFMASAVMSLSQGEAQERKIGEALWDLHQTSASALTSDARQRCRLLEVARLVNPLLRFSRRRLVHDLPENLRYAVVLLNPRLLLGVFAVVLSTGWNTHHVREHADDQEVTAVWRLLKDTLVLRIIMADSFCAHLRWDDMLMRKLSGFVPTVTRREHLGALEFEFSVHCVMVEYAPLDREELRSVNACVPASAPVDREWHVVHLRGNTVLDSALQRALKNAGCVVKELYLANEVGAEATMSGTPPDVIVVSRFSVSHEQLRTLEQLRRDDFLPVPVLMTSLESREAAATDLRLPCTVEQLRAALWKTAQPIP